MRAVIRTNSELNRFCDLVSEKLDGKPYTISVRKFHRPRTLDQNAKFHAMIRELAEHTGYSDSEMKDIIKGEFGPVKVIEVGARIVEIPKPTNEMTLPEMGHMIEHLYQIGAEVGCMYTEVT